MMDKEESKDMLLDYCSRFPLDIASPMFAKGMENLENEFFVRTLEVWHIYNLDGKRIKKRLIAAGKQSSKSYEIMQSNASVINGLLYDYLMTT